MSDYQPLEYTDLGRSAEILTITPANTTQKYFPPSAKVKKENAQKKIELWLNDTCGGITKGLNRNDRRQRNEKQLIGGKQEKNVKMEVTRKYRG